MRLAGLQASQQTQLFLQKGGYGGDVELVGHLGHGLGLDIHMLGNRISSIAIASGKSLYSHIAFFAGADSIHLSDVRNKNLAIPDLTGLGVLHNGIDHLFCHVIGHD